ncbi:MAG TPA: hypothetical protein VIV11_13100 [Kofleriaceae bacterium]
MKLVIAGTFVALVVAIAALSSSCSIRHRSDQYACTVNTDCDGGRICDNGYCIVPGSIDAPKPTDARPPGDANNCPDQCTTCNVALKTCSINCQQANCNNAVTCPPGYKCDIMCNTDNACRNGINCQMAASCNIDCTGKQSCENVQCGSGPCDVGCIGPASCRNVRCNNSCACDVVCTGNQSCAEGIVCSSLACRSGSGCTSVPAFCHACL